MNVTSIFSEAYVNEFHRKVDEYLENGWKENKADPYNYGASFEWTLLNRIAKYRRNFFCITLNTYQNIG